MTGEKRARTINGVPVEIRKAQQRERNIAVTNALHAFSRPPEDYSPAKLPLYSQTEISNSWHPEYEPSDAAEPNTWHRRLRYSIVRWVREIVG